MRILYLTALENTNGNEIHKNQILNLAGHGIDYIFLFLSPLFILNKRGFSINRNKFNRKDVIEIKLPLFSFNFCLYVMLIPIYIFIASILFIYIIHKVKPDIVHCRNMLSTLLASFCRTTFYLKYKIVCEPRSVYVEECVIQKYFKYNGINYKIWKKIERYLYKDSDACIGLSPYFKDYLLKYNSNSQFIPAVVQDNAVFSNERRNYLREKYHLTEKDKVICYIGSIGTWHSIEKLESYIDKIINQTKDKLNIWIVLLTGNRNVIHQITKKFDKNVLFCGRVEPEYVVDYLLLSDYGILPGSDNFNYCYDLLYKTMISSKAEEYLVAGLPLIVNQRITSVVNYVEEHDAGIIMNDVFVNKEFDRNTISNESLSIFGINNVTEKFKHLYNILK